MINLNFKVGDLVTRISHKHDIVFKIVGIKNNVVFLKGVDLRLYADCDMTDLVSTNHTVADKEIIDENIRNIHLDRNQYFYLPGRILHIDGDEEYLNSCMDLYKDMNLFANGICIKEDEIKYKIEKLILDLTPDIVVITGHDYYNNQGIKDLSNYKNTSHFIDALRIIRKHFSSDSLIVIIGACGSHFEALIASGANFSSSPKRINIHTYDPAILAIKAATTSNNQNIDFYQALKYIEDGHDAFGGIETKGKMKILL